MIDETNYSKLTMKRVTEILSTGTKKAISIETGETESTVANVWYGKQYKKNIVDAIVARYRKTLQNHLLNNVA